LFTTKLYFELIAIILIFTGTLFLKYYLLKILK